jgi:integrase
MAGKIRKIALTPAAVDELKTARTWDLLTPGLAIELLSRGKKRWLYRRQVVGSDVMATLFGGLYPAQSIADAREWARALNEMVESGIDPRVALREQKARAEMTVARAHELYMIAAREGRSSRAKRPNKPRTISDKLEIYDRDIAPKLAKRSIYEITEGDLIKLVEAKGKLAKIRANRLAAELKVFFGWAASLRGLEVGLEADPSRRLGDLRFPETGRSRKFSLQEIEWFLRALVDEQRFVQRGMLLWLLTAARISEVVRAKSAETVDGVWTIPSPRAKNSSAHRIALGPWGRSLIARMSELAGYTIEHFTPHDFRRTARSNTKRLKVDYETAEAMLNHLKKGLERTYDLYELEDEKRAWFLKWEQEIAGIARCAGIAEALGVPDDRQVPRPATVASSFRLTQSGIQPIVRFGPVEQTRV